MIGYVFLSLGASGTAACLYYVAPAGRGLHRYVRPPSQLRAELARAEAEASSLACDVGWLLIAVQAARRERDDATAALTETALYAADLERQLSPFDELCAENTRLRAELANATAVRQLLPGPSPADDASALPDHVQEFADQTATAWRASA